MLRKPYTSSGKFVSDKGISVKGFWHFKESRVTEGEGNKKSWELQRKENRKLAKKLTRAEKH